MPPIGGAPAEVATYYGDSVAYSPTNAAPLGWDHLISGTDLLDRTDPTNPLLLADGTYFVGAVIAAQDAFGSPLAMQAESNGYRVPIVGMAVVQVFATVAYMIVALAGQSVPVNLTRANDGGASKRFALTVSTIVKLS